MQLLRRDVIETFCERAKHAGKDQADTAVSSEISNP
jgi:hypothetical protein